MALGGANRPGAVTGGRRWFDPAISSEAEHKRRRPYAAGIKTRAVSGRKSPAEGRAQHPDHPARRCRLRPAGYLRRPGPYADAVAARQRRHQLQRLPHHVDLLADARGAADRPQPSARRLRHHRRACRRLGRLYRRHPARTSATIAKVLRQLRLQDRGLRQVAQHARQPDHRDGAVHAAGRPARHRLRLFLRLPRRRDLAMGAAADREPQPGRAAARREISSERGPGRQGDRLAAQARAFAPDKPFFMYWAPGAGHGPHHIFKEWADKYKGKFDDGWDALRERTFERQKELGWIPADTQADAARPTHGAWDSIPEAERPFQTPADGDFRRLHRACRCAGRQG